MSSSPREIGRLLVTGVPGWLTSALLQSLREDPPPGLTAVRCLLQPGQTPQTGPGANRQPFMVEYAVGDLRDITGLVIATQGIDTIFHAAGVIHVRRTHDWYEINSGGTERLIQAALKARVERFVFVSSNAAAGRSETRDRPLTEADPPRPLSHYGRSKWLAEKAVNARQGKLQTVILRPCMFYGPPVPERHIKVYRRILNGRMPLVGDGHFARSLSYIDNLVQGCRLALSHPAADGQTYYICDKPIYTTKRIVEAMATALRVSPRFLRLPRSIGPLAYKVDMALARLGCYCQTWHLMGEADWDVGVSCEKACRELGYAPRIELEEGMAKAVEWCRAMGKLP